MLAIKTPETVAQCLAERLRERRLELGWSRDELADRSGVNVANIKRFELIGEIALSRLLKLSFVLDALDTFNEVLNSKPPLTMEELKRQNKTRLRGRRRDK
jgi:transcriptional regulator with XRE-family HTH domain